MAKTIYTYTRAQAIQDGLLVDVSEMATDLFEYPVAITATMQDDILAIPEHLEGIASYDGRLWDVLWMAHCSIKFKLGIKVSADVLLYPLQMSVRGSGRQVYQVKLICSPNDDKTPCITLMKEDES